MEVVRRIFYMVGAEGESLRAVANKLEREGLPTPKRAKHWNRSFFRACIRDDVYRPHSFEEIKAVVTLEVAARLDPSRSYGLWWFNRLGHKVQHVSEPWWPPLPQNSRVVSEAQGGVDSGSRTRLGSTS